MLVKCNVIGCGYNSGMFCTSKLLCITNNGQCKRLTNPDWETVPENSQVENINIIENPE